ncbi:MAG: tyrosine-type recombinase/integrase [Bacteroidales bacterium]
MKKPIEPEIFSVDGTMRIGIRFRFDPHTSGLVRRLPGAHYSGERKCWHIAVRTDIVTFLREWFGEDYMISEPTGGDDPTAEENTTIASADDWIPKFIPTTRRISSEGNEKPLKVVEPYISADADELEIPPWPGGAFPQQSEPESAGDLNRTSPGDPEPTTAGSHEPPTPAGRPAPPGPEPGQPAGGRSSIQSDHPAPTGLLMRRTRVEIANIPGSRMMMIKFHGWYDKSWIAEMRQYGRVDYLKGRNEWRLPWSKQAVDSLSDYFSVEGLEVEVRRNVIPVAVVKQRDEIAGEIRQRELGVEGHEAVRLLERHLREKRQSESTIKTYTSMLLLFFKYFDDRRPDEITTGDVSEFMTEFVIPLDYSASFQNQLVTAIKTYYTLTGGKVSTASLLRPRRSRPLPKVFSREEVKRILNSTVNIKHRLILWMIYSCGLRRGEITNIKLTDLDRSRNLLHIREGKGKVDRVVPMSAKVWEKVDDYIEGFSPKVYLFEGQSGGRYTTGSVYNVFRKALSRSGIKKEVGVHALRHSYATHLHESGLDIRYIQELLGHRSSRTTEIYTHVSRRSLMSVRNPIDDIDLK